MSFRVKTRLLRFTPLRDASSPAPSLSALGDLPFSGPAHCARQRPERGAGGCLSASRADAGRAEGERYAYTGHREELVHSEIALPDETPQWLRTLVDGRTPAQASAALWNKFQAEATRANAIYAREVVIGLPAELSREQQVALMRDYVRDAFTSRGMVADWVIHDKGPAADKRIG